MNATVLAALIGAIASIIVNLISVSTQRHKDAIKQARADQALQDRLASIETKLDQHNGYAEKFSDVTREFGNIRTDIAVIKNDIKNIYKQGA